MGNLILTENTYGKFLAPDWETVGISIIQGNFWDSFLIPYYDKYSSLESTVVDVGANIGIHTVYLAKRSKKVYAFEAQKWVYWLLCANLALNYCFNVEAINKAAFDRESMLSFATNIETNWHFNFDSNGEVDYLNEPIFSAIALAPRSGNIPACRVDSIVPLDEPVSLIKTDAQACDLRVLVGCEKIIERWHPCILFEYELASETIHGDSLDDYYAFLAPFGYKFTKLVGGTSPADVACEMEIAE